MNDDHLFFSFLCLIYSLSQNILLISCTQVILHFAKLSDTVLFILHIWFGLLLIIHDITSFLYLLRTWNVVILLVFISTHDSHSAKPDWWLGGMGHLSSHKWQTYLWPCLKSNWSWGRVLHRQWTGLCFTSPPSPSIMSLSICELYQCFSTLVRNNHPHFQPGHHWVLGRSCSQTCSKRFSQEHLRVIPYLQKWPAQGHRRHTWLMLVPLNIFI
jgi:hypothetical protein